MTDLKILVLSDSHRTVRYMQEAIERENPDHVIHLGDHTGDAEELRQLFPMLPVLSVRGNCDYDMSARELVVTEFGPFRFFICHGHRYGVKNGLLRLELAAREALADVVLFGHTHCGYCDRFNELWLLNPGSCGYGARPSFGLIEVDQDRIECCLAYFDE